MDLIQAVKERHSVRRYTDKVIEAEIREKIDQTIEECNKEGGLHIQSVYDEPKAFDSFMAHYGKFYGVKNYVVLIGAKGQEEKIGYYGEKIALVAQSLGLNSCWVAMTYKKIKTAFKLNEGEKVYCVVSLGYGESKGVPHKSKSFSQVAQAENAPEWFVNGVNCALLAPTAMNQQKFKFTLEDGKVFVKNGLGFYSKIDLGIAKFHFELGAGKENFVWGK